VPAETSVVVTGWGSTGVSQHILYYVEQKLTFSQNFSKWSTTYHKPSTM